MIDRESLSAEHAALAGMVRELQAIAQQPQADGVRVAQVRWAMSRALTAHLAKEDRLLYPRLRASRDGAVAATADRFAHEMGGLADRWRRYIADWPGERIRADWAGFTAETRTVMHAVARRIEREEGELYPLLSRA